MYNKTDITCKDTLTIPSVSQSTRYCHAFISILHSNCFHWQRKSFASPINFLASKLRHPWKGTVHVTSSFINLDHPTWHKRSVHYLVFCFYGLLLSREGYQIGKYCIVCNVGCLATVSHSCLLLCFKYCQVWIWSSDFRMSAKPTMSFVRY